MESFVFEKLTPFLAAKSLAMMEAGLRILLILVVAYVGIRAVRFGLHKLEIFLLTMKDNEDKNRLAAEKRAAAAEEAAADLSGDASSDNEGS